MPRRTGANLSIDSLVLGLSAVRASRLVATVEFEVDLVNFGALADADFRRPVALPGIGTNVANVFVAVLVFFMVARMIQKRHSAMLIMDHRHRRFDNRSGPRQAIEDHEQDLDGSGH